MNERIKELHNLACRIDMEQHPDAIPDGERIQQRFAELIIRESVAVADEYVKDCTCEEHINCKHRTSAIGRKIREHFGVKRER